MYFKRGLLQHLITEPLVILTKMARNTSSGSIPVGRVNERRPLGHSGHRRLQEVVGSSESAMGSPLGRGRPVSRLTPYEPNTRAALSARRGVSLERKFKPSKTAAREGSISGQSESETRERASRRVTTR